MGATPSSLPLFSPPPSPSVSCPLQETRALPPPPEFKLPPPSPLRLGELRLQVISCRMNVPLTFPSLPLCYRTPPFPSPAVGAPSSNTAAPNFFSASQSTRRYSEPLVSSPCPPSSWKPPSARRQHLIDDRPSPGHRWVRHHARAARGDRARRATPAPRADFMAGRGQQCQDVGWKLAQHLVSIFFFWFFIFDYIFRNWYKLQKCIENTILLGKI
jgi:hypothetical protein